MTVPKTTTAVTRYLMQKRFSEFGLDFLSQTLEESRLLGFEVIDSFGFTYLVCCYWEISVFTGLG